MNEYENEVKKLDEQLEQAIQKQADALFNQEYEAAIENNLSYSEFSRKIVELSRRCNPDRLHMTLRNKLYNFEKEFKVPIITKEPPLPLEKMNIDAFDSLIYSYERLNQDTFTLNTNDFKPKLSFNFNGLSQEELFELTNNVVKSAVEQIVNLHKGKSYKEALAAVENMRKENNTRVNKEILNISKLTLNEKMKNSPVK